jgi:hypothetical protein
MEWKSVFGASYEGVREDGHSAAHSTIWEAGKEDGDKGSRRSWDTDENGNVTRDHSTYQNTDTHT